jgi:GPI mannosyltransferase 3
LKEIITSKYNRYLLAGLALTVLCAWFSKGFYYPDERYQVLEFCNFKMGNPAAVLPWEFFMKVRAALLPVIAFVFATILNLVGLYNQITLAFVLRLFAGITAWFITCRFCLLLLSKFKTQGGKVVLIVMSLFLWFMPFLMVRFTVENVSGIVFLYGLYPILIINKQTANIFQRYLIAGLWFGITLFIRVQMVFAIAGFVAWLIFIRKTKWKNIVAIGISIVAAIGLNVLIDRWFYGSWVFTPYNYYYANVVKHVAADFGVRPFWFYFSEFITKGFPVISVLLLLLFIIGAFKNPKTPLLWIFIPFFLAHCLVEHKELRFLFPMTFIFIYIASQGFDYLLTIKTYQKFHKYVFIILILLCVPLLAYRTFIPAPISPIQSFVLPPEMELSNYYSKVGPHDSIMKYYKLAYEKYGRVYQYALTNYANMLIRDNDTDDAIPVYSSAITYYPHYLLSYFQLFSIYNSRHYEDKTDELAILFLKTYDKNPAQMYRDSNTTDSTIRDNCNHLLQYSVKCELSYSMKKKDTATYLDAYRRMQDLHMN